MSKERKLMLNEISTEAYRGNLLEAAVEYASNFLNASKRISIVRLNELRELFKKIKGAKNINELSHVEYKILDRLLSRERPDRRRQREKQKNKKDLSAGSE
jgi:hypothetical protein